MKELQTDRLLLRMFRDSDLDAYAEMLADPEVVRYIGTGEPGDREVAWRSMATHLGKGYATEAAQAALGFAFDELEMPRVTSLIQPDNVNSIRVAKRLGEKLFGTLDLKGKPCLVYAIEREEWRGRIV